MILWLLMKELLTTAAAKMVAVVTGAVTDFTF